MSRGWAINKGNEGGQLRWRVEAKSEGEEWRRTATLCGAGPGHFRVAVCTQPGAGSGLLVLSDGARTGAASLIDLAEVVRALLCPPLPA